MVTDEQLQRGRDAFARRAWRDAYRHLAAADEATPLEPEDVELLATAASLIGRDDAADELWARAHQAFLDADEPADAVRCAFWLASGLMQRGEHARGSGWLARARRLCEDRDLDCAERGYLLVPTGLRQIEEGDVDAAASTFDDVTGIAARFDDPDVMALGRLGRGEALIRRGDTEEGLALFDEVMVAVTSGEVSPRISGLVYCAVIDTCQRILDVDRAQQWTAALTDWCASQPDLVPYRGQCLVHRAQLKQLHGDWGDALEEARRARERLSEPPHPAVGMAHYELGELHRLRGAYDDAEEAYRRANERGHRPYPGLALLWAARGRPEAAADAIRGALADAGDDVERFRLLPAAVEIMLACDAHEAARAAADELATLADRVGAPLARAMAAQARGAVRLAADDPDGALGHLRKAWRLWQDLDVPYEAARTQVLMGTAHRAVGDGGTAELDRDSARRTFEQLGAAPAIEELEALTGTPGSGEAGPLTPREVEVLRLVAGGSTNRQIAEDLVISEKTVERHLSNVFTKLDVSNRTAATAYAFEHDLL